MFFFFFRFIKTYPKGTRIKGREKERQKKKKNSHDGQTRQKKKTASCSKTLGLKKKKKQKKTNVSLNERHVNAWRRRIAACLTLFIGDKDFHTRLFRRESELSTKTARVKALVKLFRYRDRRSIVESEELSLRLVTKI